MSENKQQPEQRPERRFFDAVVNTLARKCLNFHYPRKACWNGWCKETGVGLVAPYTLHCNWRDILTLSTEFYRKAPDVDDGWERIAERASFSLNGHELRDIMLGVFIGGDAGRNPIGPWSERDSGISTPTEARDYLLRFDSIKDELKARQRSRSR